MTSLRERVHAATRGEAGAVTLEAAILSIGMIGLLILLIGAARIGLAQQSVTAAAAAAARGASLASDSSSANTAAQQMAATSLADSSVTCASTDVTVNAAGLNAALGQIGRVTVTVRCIVSNSSAAVIGMPGTTTLSATSSSPVDAYKERS